MNTALSSILPTGPRLVHLGVGAFHRAHQAVYTQEAGGGWRICGLSLRRPEVRDRLRGRAYNYTLAVKDGAKTRLSQIDVLEEVLVAPESPERALRRLAAPETQLATLTITEKGYCLNAEGGLDERHPDVLHDLQRPQQPRSALGYLAAGLERRRAEGHGGLTLLSCDNLAGNGKRLQAALLGLAHAQSRAALADWIEAKCRFPSSMVDRIVPATTEADRQAAAEQLGFEDPGLVVTEPFTQWVIEDSFAAARPAWEKAGAQLVADVAPYEAMKLRLLNASHSALAYLGCLAGIPTLGETLAAPGVKALLQQLMAEMDATLEGLAGFDTEAYRQTLLQRIANPGLRHLTRQVAMDGSQKIPQRIFPGLERQLTAGLPFAATALALAAWVRYTQGVDDQGRAYELDDPRAAEFSRLRAAKAGDPAAYLQGFIQLPDLFPKSLATHPALQAAMEDSLQSLARQGALATVQARFGKP